MSKNVSYSKGEKYNSLSKKDGFRSRAAYKLIQIQKQNKIIKAGDKVLDIGSSPGGWSQVASNILGDSGSIIAIDILPMKEIRNVNFFQIDLKDVHKINLNKVSIVLSDIAPNISGIGITDSENMIELLNIEIYLINKFLVKGGSFLAKCFQGSSFDHLKEFMKNNFEEVLRIKPEASRQNSKECYLLGKFKK